MVTENLSDGCLEHYASPIAYELGCLKHIDIMHKIETV